LLLRLTVPNTGEDFDASIGSLLKAFGRLNRYGRFKAAVVHWFRALEVSPGRDGVMTVMGQKGYKLLRLPAAQSTAVFGAIPASPVQALDQHSRFRPKPRVSLTQSPYCAGK
jgi:hypothetical protein